MTVHFASSYVDALFNVTHGARTSQVLAYMPMGLNNRSAFSSDKGGFVSGTNVTSGTVSGFLVGASSPTGAGISLNSALHANH